MKRLLKILAVLIVLLVIAGVVAFLMLDTLAASAIRKGGTYALGVETTVDGVDLHLGSEVQAGLSGLAVKNPEGFDAEHFLRLQSGSLRFPASGLFADLVTVPELALTGIEVDLQRKGGQTNYGVLLDNLAKLGGGGQEPAPEQVPPGGGKRFRIDRIVLKDIKADIDLLPLGGVVGGVAGDATRVSVAIPQIEIEDVGSDMSTAQIFSLVIRTLLTAVVQNAGGLLPADMLQELSARLGELGKVPFQLSGDVTKLGTEALESGVKQVGEELEKVGGAAGEAIKGVGGILKKKKD
jgi:hypothetical protein